MTLAHFSEDTVRRYADNNLDPRFKVKALFREGGLGFVAVTMPFAVKFWAAFFTLLLVGSTVTAMLTFSWLDDDQLAIVPIVSCVVAGALLVLVYVLIQISGQLAALTDGTVQAEDVRLYLDKLDGKGGVGGGAHSAAAPAKQQQQQQQQQQPRAGSSPDVLEPTIGSDASPTGLQSGVLSKSPRAMNADGEQVGNAYSTFVRPTPPPRSTPASSETQPRLRECL